MKPLVSLVTPIFNCETFLAESLQSALDQTFTDFEIIIVNDGSTDGSKDVALSFKDDRIRFVDNADNKRIPTRRNEAIEHHAVGKYICIHDGDDVSLPDRLERQVKVLEEVDDLFCIGGWAKKIDLEGEDCGVMDYPPTSYQSIVRMITRKCRNPMIDPTTVFRRDQFLQLGKYTLEKAIYTVPDFDVWCRAIERGWRFRNILDYLIKYRVNPDGMTRQHKDEMIRAHMIVWRRFMGRFYGRVKMHGSK
jgi:glycosyltransferase involved in cell wall biosynthesis